MEEIITDVSRQGNTCVTEKFLMALELFHETGNVSRSCRSAGISRKTFYKWRRRLPAGSGRPDDHAHPAPPEPEWKTKALSLCLENPEWGCDRISYYLHLHGMEVSSPTIQKHLIRHGLGRVRQRLLESRRLSEAGENRKENSPRHLGGS